MHNLSIPWLTLDLVLVFISILILYIRFIPLKHQQKDMQLKLEYQNKQILYLQEQVIRLEEKSKYAKYDLK